MLGRHARSSASGPAAALDPGLAIGELVTAERALSDDGASAALGARRDSVGADAALTARCSSAGGGRAVTAVSTDLFYDPREDRSEACGASAARRWWRWRRPPCSSSRRSAAWRPAACSA